MGDASGSGLLACCSSVTVPFANVSQTGPVGTASARLLLESLRSGAVRLASISVEIPLPWWSEWKSHRLCLWRGSKLWPKETASSSATKGSHDDGVPGDNQDGMMPADSDTATSTFDTSGPPPPSAI